MNHVELEYNARQAGYKMAKLAHELTVQLDEAKKLWVKGQYSSNDIYDLINKESTAVVHAEWCFKQARLIRFAFNQISIRNSRRLELVGVVEFIYGEYTEDQAMSHYQHWQDWDCMKYLKTFGQNPLPR
jgi:hypothetical protein